jgi:hypothetical protein
VIGAAVDFGVARHWQSAIQFVPWAVLGDWRSPSRSSPFLDTASPWSGSAPRMVH